MAMTGLDLSIFDLDFPTPEQIKRNYFEFLDVQQYSDDGEGASMSNFEDSDSSLFGASLQNYREYVGTPPHAQEVSAVPSFLGMTSASGMYKMGITWCLSSFHTRTILTAFLSSNNPFFLKISNAVTQ